MAQLSKDAIYKIESAVNLLFDRLNGSVFGPDFIHHRQDKNIFINFKPHVSLPGIYTMSAGEEFAEPSKEVLDSLVHIAHGYIESQRHVTKAQIINAVTSFLSKNKKGSLETVLGGQLAGIYTKLEQNIVKIVASESNKYKNLGTLEGIVKAFALRGIEDPVVAFIGPNDSHVCEECRRTLYVNFPVPKCFLLSDVKSGYHVRGEDSASMSGQHPHCFTENTRIHTQYGLLTIKELFNIGGDLKVTVDARIRNRKSPANQFGKEIPGQTWLYRHGSGSVIKPASAVYETGILPCVRVETERGLVLEVSEDHEIWIDDNANGKKIKAVDLKIGDKLPTLSGEGQFGEDHFPELAELMGNLLGDGTLNIDLASWQFFGDDISYGNKLIELARPFAGHQLSDKMAIRLPDNLYNIESCGFNSTVIGRMLVKDFGLSKLPRRVPNRIWGATKETVSAFLRGLYAADGSSLDAPGVSISQTDREFLMEIQLLLSNYGIRSGLYDHEKAHEKIFNINGKSRTVHCNDSWRLVIGGWNQVKKFCDDIGLGVPEKQRKLLERLESRKNEGKLGAWRTDHVKSITSIGLKKTYCLTEPMSNTVTANGLVVGQCRHQIISVMPGYGFDEGGKIKFFSKTYNVLEEQAK